jgi:hypothetical protein
MQDSLERETECHSLRVDMENLMKARDEEVQSLREIVDDVEETYTSEVGLTMILKKKAHHL